MEVHRTKKVAQLIWENCFSFVRIKMNTCERYRMATIHRLGDLLLKQVPLNA